MCKVNVFSLLITCVQTGVQQRDWQAFNPLHFAQARFGDNRRRGNH